MNSDPGELQTKLIITDKAAELYVLQNGSFTFHQISKETELEVGDIFNYFPDKRAILEFYYTSLVIRYRMMIDEIEDFDTYTLGEKLSNFVFTSFDMMAERQEFVEKSFEKVICNRYYQTEYEEEVQQLFKSFFEDDPLVATSSRMMTSNYFFSLLRQKYIGLIHFWLNDTSESRELTMELTDKSTSFLQEAVYNTILDKGFDLLKFIISNNIFIPNFPFADAIRTKFEIR